ncbi:hypothetical protein LTR15_009250 [Elasticomyces elasticus]|nr:hypothetical protein LTR15_009250 [Elasticomyces elasticus]
MTMGITPTQSGVANITSTSFLPDSDPYSQVEAFKSTLEETMETFKFDLQELSKKVDIATEATNTTRELYKEASERKLAEGTDGAKPSPQWEHDLKSAFGKMHIVVDDCEELARETCRKLPAQYRDIVAQGLTRAIHEVVAFINDKLRIALAFAAGLGNALFDVILRLFKKLKACFQLARGAVPKTLGRNAVAIGAVLA